MLVNDDQNYDLVENAAPTVLTTKASKIAKSTDKPEKYLNNLIIAYWDEEGYPNDLYKDWYVPSQRYFLLTQESARRINKERILPVNEELHYDLVSFFEAKRRKESFSYKVFGCFF